MQCEKQWLPYLGFARKRSSVQWLVFSGLRVVADIYGNHCAHYRKSGLWWIIMYECVERFKEGRTSVSHYGGSGRLSTTGDNIQFSGALRGQYWHIIRKKFQRPTAPVTVRCSRKSWGLKFRQNTYDCCSWSLCCCMTMHVSTPLPTLWKFPQKFVLRCCNMFSLKSCSYITKLYSMTAFLGNAEKAADPKHVAFLRNWT